jgi:hypothetical protein
MSDLERELAFELHRVLDPMSEMPIPPRRTAQGRGPMRSLLGGAGAALTIKLLTGVAVAAAAITVVGAATTGSLNPADWGQQVTMRVSDCKAHLTDGQHGIGECVSDFANQHGAAVASAARHHGDGDGTTNGNANGHSKDKDHVAPTKGQSTVPPTDREPADGVGPRPRAPVPPPQP